MLRVLLVVTMLTCVSFAQEQLLNECVDKIPNCAMLKDLCVVPAYKDMMNEDCMRTCDFCPNVAFTRCVDAVPNCAKLKYLCKVEAYKDMMNKACVKTCGFCPNAKADCMDRDNGCYRDRQLCTAPKTRNFMAERCPETCGYCQYYDHDKECKDIVDDCEMKLKDGYPRNSNYMRYSCAKTVNHCNAWIHSRDTGYWYKLVDKVKGFPDFMESVCVGYGGHLASIHSDSENVFLANKIGVERYAHIGLIRIPENNSVLWTDNTSVDYSNYEDKRIPPDMSSGNCMGFYYGHWGNFWCKQNEEAICKKRY